MKLTDVAMARALGWKPPEKGQAWRYWESPDRKKVIHGMDLPAFTTSLNAIVAEIKARGLVWIVGDGTTYGPLAKVYAKKSRAKVKGYRAKTAPLALCVALLAHLKEKKRGARK